MIIASKKTKKNRHQSINGPNQQGILWFIFQGHALQTYNTVACQCSNKDNTKYLSLVSSKGAVTVFTVSHDETVQCSTSYLFNSSCLSPKQQTLAKGLYRCQLPPLLIWFHTSPPWPVAVGHWPVQAFCLDICLWRQNDFCCSFFSSSVTSLFVGSGQMDCRCSRTIPFSPNQLCNREDWSEEIEMENIQ